MRINDTAYENNLVFYSMLKFLVQSKCDDNKILRLKRALVANKDAIISDRSNLVPLILESGSVAARDTGAYNGLLTFFSYKGTDYNEMWFDKPLRVYLEWLESETGVDISVLGTSAKNGDRIIKSQLIKELK